jgi:hypothetical protein
MVSNSDVKKKRGEGINWIQIYSFLIITCHLKDENILDMTMRKIYVLMIGYMEMNGAEVETAETEDEILALF